MRITKTINGFTSQTHLVTMEMAVMNKQTTYSFRQTAKSSPFFSKSSVGNHCKLGITTSTHQFKTLLFVLCSVSLGASAR